ncbi:uncharacterized protein VTP21DRAFT_9755 [Calcarisporiella thermophila]|uniref:uncharacterized protein n=1 Tax=Calcarisporiella thermophila TaxID=911321 RepID=UPI0037425FD1
MSYGYPPPQGQGYQGGQQQPYYPPPPPQQQYAPPPNPPPPQSQPYYMPPPPTYQSGPDGYASPQQSYQPPPPRPQDSEKFNPQPKCNDVFFAILFIVHLLGFVVLSYFGLSAAVDKGIFSGRPSGSGTSSSINLDTGLIVVLFILAVIGFVISFFYVLLAQRFPRFFIKFTFLLSILVYIGVTIFFFVMGYFVGAIIFLIFSVLFIMMWFWWKSRIPFAVVMLETVTSIMRKYYGTVIIAIAGLVVAIAYNVWWILTVIGLYQWLSTTTTQPNGTQQTTSDGRLVVAMIYSVFSFYWVTQVIEGVIHVTVSGAFASYYFLYGTPTAPSNPTIGSLKRALTTSFGSVCFGGLLIAIIQTLRTLTRSAAYDSNNAFAAFCLICIDCLLACIEGILEYINFYAYTQCAIYGKPFLRAAKDTWTIIKDRGIEQIINDNLVGNVVGMGAFLVGIITGVLGYIYLVIAKPAFNGGAANGPYTVIIVFVSFLLGLQMMYIFGSVILSGNATTFVALAEDPGALARTKPELFEKIRQTWPRVVQGV